MEKPAEPEFNGVVTLGGGDAKFNIGRNKSGMPWKKNSKRSEFKKGLRMTFAERKIEAARLKALRARSNAIT